MARVKLNHEQLCSLVDVEPAPQEEWSELYRAWKKSELEDLWRDLKRIEESRLRRLQHRREHIERLLGIRLNVRVPKHVVTPPSHVLELIEKS